MRAEEVRIGGEYLTRAVRVSGVFGDRTTRGHVRVLARGAFRSWWQVQWLMRDGSERPGMPEELPSSKLLVEVKQPTRGGQGDG